MNLLYILIPVVLVGIGIGAYFIFRKKSSTPTTSDKAVSLQILIGETKEKV
jgi:hypothetical protein